MAQAMHRRRPNKKTPIRVIHDDPSDSSRWTDASETEDNIDYNEIIDLTTSSDADEDTSEDAGDQNIPEGLEPPRNRNAKMSPITAGACLQMVLNVFPDMSVEHALKTIKERTTDDMRTIAQCEQVVAQLLDDGAYPKEADAVRGKKRKREDSNDVSDYENGGVDPGIGGYIADV